MGRVGNRYVWQGGQTENQGGQTKKKFRRFAPNFAHPGLKPCRRPWLLYRHHRRRISLAVNKSHGGWVSGDVALVCWASNRQNVCMRCKGRDTRADSDGRHCRARFLTTDIDGRQWRSSFLATVNVGRQWRPSGRTDSRQGRLFNKKARPFTWPPKMLASFDFGGFFSWIYFVCWGDWTFHRHS